MEANALTIILAAISAVAAVVVMSLFYSKKTKTLMRELQESERQSRELEKSIHLLEAENLKARNLLELEHHESTKSQREKLFQEGFESGLRSSQKDHMIEITKLQSFHRDDVVKKEKEAAEKAYKIAKAEIETQTKAFSVEIRPYVKIEKDDGLIWDNHKSYTGYQYQLLVNGIPAFQPHVVIEHSEEISKVDKEMVNQLVQAAIKAADNAAQVYLSGATGNMFRIGPEIVQQVKV